MSGQQVCVTNLVREMRPCVVKGAHVSNCDGFERRYNPVTGQTEHRLDVEWNPDTRQTERFLRECPGCLPRRAASGLLCDAHVKKLEHAFGHDEVSGRVLVDLVTHVWSVESNGIRDDNTKVSTGAAGSSWTLSESHIAANAIYTELAATAVAFATDLRVPEPPFSAAASILDGFQTDLDVDIVGVLVRDLVDWLEEYQERAIRRRHSAEAAVRLVDVAQTALARFPLVDSDHHVPFVRCPSCSRMAMTWKPPLMQFDEVVVKCEKCGHTESQEWLEEYVAIVKTDPRRRAL